MIVDSGVGLYVGKGVGTGFDRYIGGEVGSGDDVVV